MNPLSMLESVSISGGDAAPSSAGGGDAYIAMNSPFNVTGRGSSAGGTSTVTLLLLVAAVGFIGWALK